MEPLDIGMTRATDAKSTFLLPEKLPDRRARGEVPRALSSPFSIAEGAVMVRVGLCWLDP
jgi:hypothetical protein